MTKQQIEREVAVLAIMLAKLKRPGHTPTPGDWVRLHDPQGPVESDVLLVVVTQEDILNADAGWNRNASAASPPEGRPGPIGRALGKGSK